MHENFRRTKKKKKKRRDDDEEEEEEGGGGWGRTKIINHELLNGTKQQGIFEDVRLQGCLIEIK